MDPIQVQPPVENYANPKTCFFHVLFKASALAFYVLSTLFVSSFVIIFVVTVLLAALDFWVVKNVTWIILGIFSVIRFEANFLLVVAVCLSLSIANIMGFTKCQKDAKKQLQRFATQTLASRVSSTIQSAFSAV
ncbi:Golgi apparatus membrane protein-like protein [Drosera capensis]